MMIVSYIEFLLENKHSQKMTLLGYCDKLRVDDVNEVLWQNMMLSARQISKTNFINSVDLTEILDKDETVTMYLSNVEKSDPDTRYYESTWGNKKCMFIKTMGFEIIFV